MSSNQVIVGQVMRVSNEDDNRATREEPIHYSISEKLRATGRTASQWRAA